MNDLAPGTRVNHYKNKPYQFLFYALHSESLEELAVYECLYENSKGHLWVRPRSMFEEKVTGPHGTPVERFGVVTDPSGNPEGGLGVSSGQASFAASKFFRQAQIAFDQFACNSKQTDCLDEALENAYAAQRLWREAREPHQLQESLKLIEQIKKQIQLA